ncbi:hypothetical protein GE09DRAFT_1055227 [Coniochaeta sp. 2T2.1]|nr:hypothetical protein GE09DRAFT_1055227 [Coniochaeta sp. 2T2.1]
MSETPPPPHQPPLDNERRYRIATEIIHSILDDRPPTATVSPSGELYRAIERFHRNVDRVRREIPAARPPGSGNMSSNSDRDLRRRFTRSPPASSSGALDDLSFVYLPSIQGASPHAPSTLPPTSGASPHAPSLPPLRHTLNSRRLLPTDTSRERVHWTDLSRDSAESLERLEDANSHLRTLLDFTETSPILPSMPPRELSPPLRNPDPHDEGRRPKRRRLESDRATSTYRGFRYGKYGQSEPGQLTLELHQGATVFSMSELVIKAPGTGFSAPVREGMLFMGMDSNDIFQRTASYQIQYLTEEDVARLAGREGRSIPAQPAVYSIRHGENGAQVTRLPPAWARSYDGHHRIDFDGDEDGDEDMGPSRPQIAQLPHEFTLPPPPFTITSECSSDDFEGDAPGGGGGLRRSRSFPRIPNRIGTLPFESDDDDDDAGDDVWVPSNTSGWGAFDEVTRQHYQHLDRRRPAPPHATAARQRQRGESESRSLQEAREASQIATQEAVRAVGGDLMTPLVHFHIEEHNKCTIKFDPPVSGRFLLLKMWSSRNNVNIDIQGVTVKGFAGPRAASYLLSK